MAAASAQTQSPQNGRASVVDRRQAAMDAVEKVKTHANSRKSTLDQQPHRSLGGTDASVSEKSSVEEDNDATVSNSNDGENAVE